MSVVHGSAYFAELGYFPNSFSILHGLSIKSLNSLAGHSLECNTELAGLQVVTLNLSKNH